MIGGTDCEPPFDLCVVQVGIVDRTPRLFSRRVGRLVGRFRVGSRLVNMLRRIRWQLKSVGKPWVSLGQFERNVIGIKNITSQLAACVCFIEIAKPAHHLVDNCGYYSGVIQEYAAVLKEILGCGYMAAYEGVDLQNQLLPDGHHVAVEGHKKIAEKTLKLLS